LCVGESIETADIKICDLGQAREVRSRPPYTEYVSTRWYRAPEVLLRSRYYNSPVDMWAAGVTMAELFAGRPAFPGTSEVNQLYLLLEALGPPSHEYWADGVRQMKALHLTMPRTSGAKGLAALCPRASAPALQLLGELLQLNPARRATAASALASDWFAGMPPVVVPAAGEEEGGATGSATGSAGAGASGSHGLSAAASASSGAPYTASMGAYRSGGHALSHAGSHSLRGDGTGVARGVSDGQVLAHGARRPPVSTDRHHRAAHSTREASAAGLGMDARGHGRSSSVPHTRPRAGHSSIGASAASGLPRVPEAGSSVPMGSSAAEAAGAGGGIAYGAGTKAPARAGLALAPAASASAAGRSYHMHSPKAGALSTASGFAGAGWGPTVAANSAGASTMPPRLATDALTAGDSSASLIAMARELGVGVSPLPTPGRSGDASTGVHASMRGFGSDSAGGEDSVGGAGAASLYSGGGETGLSLTGARADSQFDVGGPGSSTGALSSVALAGSTARGESWVTAESGVLGGGPLSPVQRGGHQEDDKQQMSLDTDQLEALLGSLGQGTVV
jgi:hypothetical protein